MRKSTIVWLLVGFALIVAGGALFLWGMEEADWNFSSLDTDTYVTNSYEVREDFDRISINVDTTEIEFLPTDEDKCVVTCHEMKKVRHTVDLRDGTLIIGVEDSREWYEHIGIFFEKTTMTVYLPKKEYDALNIDTSTGDVTIPEGFTFGSLNIDADTSDVFCRASALNLAKIESDTGTLLLDGVMVVRAKLTTDTGDITLRSLSGEGILDVETDTGEISVRDVACTELTAESDTGDVLLKNTVATGELAVTTSTGDVRLEKSDASGISVTTSTGDVTGSLLTEKVFITESSTGRVRVPKTTFGGKCEITTSTGDVEIGID